MAMCYCPYDTEGHAWTPLLGCPKADPAHGFSRAWMKDVAQQDHGCRQVVLTEATWAAFVDWIYNHELGLFPIPDGDGGFEYKDDLPTFGVGPGKGGM